MNNLGMYRYISTDRQQSVDNVYSRCALSVWIKNHGTNMQKSVLKALL